MTLAQRLACKYIFDILWFICRGILFFLFLYHVDHREHGNRIMHEFILGVKNVLRTQTRPKSTE